MDSKEKEILHIITKSGVRKTIPFPDQNSINESNIDEEYDVDIDWYLNHGYKKWDDAIKEIEDGIL